MRYRVGEEAAQSGAMTGASGTEAVLVFTLIISIIMGVFLVWLGWRGRQIWLVTWSAGLVVVSIATWVYMLI